MFCELWNNRKFYIANINKSIKFKRKKTMKKYNKIKTSNDHKIFTYGKHELKIHLINFYQIFLILNVEIIAADISEFDVILNLFWLQKCNL